jgi:hypothetical protein
MYQNWADNINHIEEYMLQDSTHDSDSEGSQASDLLGEAGSEHEMQPMEVAFVAGLPHSFVDMELNSQDDTNDTVVHQAHQAHQAHQGPPAGVGVMDAIGMLAGGNSCGLL